MFLETTNMCHYSLLDAHLTEMLTSSFGFVSLGSTSAPGLVSQKPCPAVLSSPPGTSLSSQLSSRGFHFRILNDHISHSFEIWLKSYLFCIYPSLGNSDSECCCQASYIGVYHRSYLDTLSFISRCYIFIHFLIFFGFSFIPDSIKSSSVIQ